MSGLQDPKARSQRGSAEQSRLLGCAAAEPETLYQSSWRDFVFAEVWTRPGLALRARYLITLASAATADTPADVLDGYVRGALLSRELSLDELREATQTEGKAPWEVCVIQLRRAGGRLHAEFVYEDATRWRVTPETLDEVAERARPA